jgi:hypothetical protein
MVLMLSFLTACPTLITDPPESFGLSAVISNCIYSTNNDYSIFCKAFYKANIALEIQANLSQNYAVLFPSNTAMKTYFAQNSLDESRFLSSPGLINFAKKHVVLGVLAPGISLMSWAGTSLSISGTTSSLIVNGAVGVTTFPLTSKIDPQIWLHALDKTIE